MGLLSFMKDWGGLIGDIGGALLGSSSAHEANRTNIKLAREQRAWEENMANTAVQRRRADIEKAGFNPLLAATGPGAATPSVASPTVNQEFQGDALKGSVTASLLAREQLASIRQGIHKQAAETALTAQEARIRKVEADAKERYGTDMADFDYQKSELSVKEAKARIEQIVGQTAQTALQREQLARTIDKLVEMVEQQARTGELNLEALENIASIGGIEGEKARGVIKTLIDLWRTSQEVKR